MGGGWVGYVYAIFGCGFLVALAAASTLILYAWARVRRKNAPEPRVLVRSVSSKVDGA